MIFFLTCRHPLTVFSGDHMKGNVFGTASVVKEWTPDLHDLLAEAVEYMVHGVAPCCTLPNCSWK